MMARIGVILAAGRGGRMGRTKQLVACQTRQGSKPLIAAAYDAIRPICDEVIVVLGHEAETVAAALGDRAFQRAVSDPSLPMFESIRAGLRAAHALDSSAIVVLQPGDHPNVDAGTLEKLTAAARENADQAVIPQFGGQGGHPALIPPSVAEQLTEADCPHGLGAWWLAHPELCCRVRVEDPAVLRDIDTPADLQE
jgi:molybdenum cofactor cytidylyltransferase